MTIGAAVGIERALIKALQRMDGRSREYWDVITEWARAVEQQQPGDPDVMETAYIIVWRHKLTGTDDWEYELQLYLAGCPEKYVLPFTLHWLVQHLTLPDEEADR